MNIVSFLVGLGAGVTATIVLELLALDALLAPVRGLVAGLLSLLGDI